jgi:hypothetical protein
LNVERHKRLTLIANIPEQKLDQVSKAIKQALSEVPSHAVLCFSVSEMLKYSRFNNGKLKLPRLPPGLTWPKKRYSQERRKHRITIESFLRSEWLPLIKAGYGELRWLRMVDVSAVRAITYFQRLDKNGTRKRLPSELRFLTEGEVTDRTLASAPVAALTTDPRAMAAIMARARHKRTVSHDR